MADRRTALRAVARQLAEQRSDGPAPRPPQARIPLPDQHLLDLASARTHRVRLHAPVLDRARFAAALREAAAHHDALRLRPRSDSGRQFLTETDDPVAEVDRVDDLAVADPDHPLRWAVMPGPGAGVTVTLAVSAYLVDRSVWAPLLSTVESAYRGTVGPSPSGPGYGDYCYWLAHRNAGRCDDADDAAAVVLGELGHPAAEPYWEFAAGARWAVEDRVVSAPRRPRADAIAALASDLARALRACGWQTPGVRLRWWSAQRPELPMVGRTDEPMTGLVRATGPGGSAPVAAVAGGLDPWWATFGEPLIQADVDVIDLPQLRLGAEVVRVEPVVEPAPGWQCLLVRRPDGAMLRLAGAEPTLAPLLNILCGQRAAGTALSVEHRRPDAPDHSSPPTPRIVTAQRTLPADVVTAAARRRADELREAGLRAGQPVVVECTDGPETVANLLAAWRCRADVLPLDPDDPPAWREGLSAMVPDAVIISADNAVRPPATRSGSMSGAPTGDGEGALLVGLSSAPADPVLARIPLPELERAARALGERWGSAQAVVVNAARAGEDAAVRMLAGAAGAAGLVLVGADGDEAVELLTADTADTVVDRHLVEGWTVPVHALTGVRWSRRGARPAEQDITTWWVAEAPGVQWSADADGLLLLAGTARVMDPDEATAGAGTLGELAVGVDPGARYVNDPRRSALRLRPAPDGRRELRTGAVVARTATGVVVLRHAPDRAVVGNRTCLTDAWRARVADGFVGTGPVGTPAEEAVVVVAPRPVGSVELPRPLAAALVRVDPDVGADGSRMDAAEAWRRFREPARRTPADARPAWATPAEAALAEEIVEPVLGMPVGRDDDLFSLGVTSLQLMRVLLQVKERTGVEVALARFFATPTVAVLAELVKEPGDATTAAMDLLEEIEGER